MGLSDANDSLGVGSEGNPPKNGVEVVNESPTMTFIFPRGLA